MTLLNSKKLIAHLKDIENQTLITKQVHLIQQCLTSKIPIQALMV